MNMRRVGVVLVVLGATGVVAMGFAQRGSEQPRARAVTPNGEQTWAASAFEARTLDEFLNLSANAPAGTQAVPYDKADLFFEENATASDLGIHFDIDHQSDDAWVRTIIFYPDGRRFITARTGSDHATTGVTGMFSESAEPNYANLPRADFLARYPEGEYTFAGITINGNVLMSTDVLTHSIPAMPTTVVPREGDVVAFDEPLTIRWRATPDPNPPSSVIIGYEVIVTKEAQPGEAKRVLSIQMLPTQRRVRIPREFLEPNKAYKYEIIARETSHNQTIAEVGFRTEVPE